MHAERNSEFNIHDVTGTDVKYGIFNSGATQYEVHGVSATVAVTTLKLQRRTTMNTKISAICCICDDILKRFQHSEDNQRQMRNAEVMMTSTVAAL